MANFGGRRNHYKTINRLHSSLRDLPTHNPSLKLLKEEALRQEDRDLKKLESGLSFSKYEEIELCFKQVLEDFKSVKKQGEDIQIQPERLENRLERGLFPNIRLSKKLQYGYGNTIKSFLGGVNRHSLLRVLTEKEHLHRILFNFSAASFEIASYLMREVSENKNIYRDAQPLNRKRHDFLKTVKRNNQKVCKCGEVLRVMRKEREKEWDKKLEEKF